MAINNPLIPGDPFSYDLKWIVMKIKYLILQGENLETALEALRAYVDQRFDDLSLQEEVNKKLDEMYNDGSLALLIAQYLDVNTPQLHGAAADGETDDTKAIQKALDSGYPVYFPSGRYLITDTLKVTRSNAKIYGSPDSYIIIGDELKLTNDAKWAMEIYSTAEPHKKLVTSAISEDGYTFTINNTDDVAPEMLVNIQGDFSTSPWTSDNRGYITKGETNIVEKVSSNTITVKIPASSAYSASEIVNATFIEPIRNVHIDSLNFIGLNGADDKRQYRGITVINGVDCMITNCNVENCGIDSIEISYNVWGVIKDCYVSKAWTYEDGTTTVIGLGYALRDVCGNNCRIENNVINEARHAVDISGKYPAVSTIVKGNIMKPGTDQAIMNTHGSANRSMISDNLIYGETVLCGENITFTGNKCYRSISTIYGRNFIFENNDAPSFYINVPNTNERGNYLIIRNNITRTERVCYIAGKEGVAYDTVYGFVCENNIVLISGTSRTGSICDIGNSLAATVTFTGGLITSNNNSLNRQTGVVQPLPLTNNMAATAVGSSEWDSVISNGLFVGVNEPFTNTIGARAYRSRLKVPVWYDGTGWKKADGTTP